MNSKDISPQIKESLSHQTIRKAPIGLHERIMKKVRLDHNHSLVAPGYTGLMIVGLLFAAIFIILPLISFTDLASIELPKIESPKTTMPTYVWTSIFAGILLLAADSYFNRLRLKKA